MSVSPPSTASASPRGVKRSLSDELRDSSPLPKRARPPSSTSPESAILESVCKKWGKVADQPAPGWTQSEWQEFVKSEEAFIKSGHHLIPETFLTEFRQAADKEAKLSLISQTIHEIRHLLEGRQEAQRLKNVASRPLDATPTSPRPSLDPSTSNTPSNPSLPQRRDKAPLATETPSVGPKVEMLSSLPPPIPSPEPSRHPSAPALQPSASISTSTVTSAVPIPKGRRRVLPQVAPTQSSESARRPELSPWTRPGPDPIFSGVVYGSSSFTTPPLVPSTVPTLFPSQAVQQPHPLSKSLPPTAPPDRIPFSKPDNPVAAAPAPTHHRSLSDQSPAQARPLSAPSVRAAPSQSAPSNATPSSSTPAHQSAQTRAPSADFETRKGMPPARSEKILPSQTTAPAVQKAHSFERRAATYQQIQQPHPPAPPHSTPSYPLRWQSSSPNPTIVPGSQHSAVATIAKLPLPGQPASVDALRNSLRRGTPSQHDYLAPSTGVTRLAAQICWGVQDTVASAMVEFMTLAPQSRAALPPRPSPFVVSHMIKIDMAALHYLQQTYSLGVSDVMPAMRSVFPTDAAYRQNMAAYYALARTCAESACQTISFGAGLDGPGILLYLQPAQDQVMLLRAMHFEQVNLSYCSRAYPGLRQSSGPPLDVPLPLQPPSSLQVQRFRPAVQSPEQGSSHGPQRRSSAPEPPLRPALTRPTTFTAQNVSVDGIPIAQPYVDLFFASLDETIAFPNASPLFHFKALLGVYDRMLPHGVSHLVHIESVQGQGRAIAVFRTLLQEWERVRKKFFLVFGHRVSAGEVPVTNHVTGIAPLVAGAPQMKYVQLARPDLSHRRSSQEQPRLSPTLPPAPAPATLPLLPPQPALSAEDISQSTHDILNQLRDAERRNPNAIAIAASQQPRPVIGQPATAPSRPAQQPAVNVSRLAPTSSSRPAPPSQLSKAQQTTERQIARLREVQAAKDQQDRREAASKSIGRLTPAQIASLPPMSASAKLYFDQRSAGIDQRLRQGIISQSQAMEETEAEVIQSDASRWYNLQRRDSPAAAAPLTTSTETSGTGSVPAAIPPPASSTLPAPTSHPLAQAIFPIAPRKSLPAPNAKPSSHSDRLQKLHRAADEARLQFRQYPGHSASPPPPLAMESSSVSGLTSPPWTPNLPAQTDEPAASSGPTQEERDPDRKKQEEQDSALMLKALKEASEAIQHLVRLSEARMADKIQAQWNAGAVTVEVDVVKREQDAP